MNAAMNKTLRNALIAAVAVVTAVLILPFVAPVGAYRDRIESAAQHATGRALRIEGPLRLMLFPQFGLKAERVTFANMPGGRAAAMASVGDIKLAIRFLPLLAGRIEVAEIILDHPVIELEVNAQGRANWTLGKNESASGGGSSVTLPLDTRFSGIRIGDGRIAYTNAKTRTKRAFDRVNAIIAVTRLDQPVSIDGNLKVGERRVDFNARIATIKSLLGNGTTALDVSLTSDMMQASFKGVMTPDGGVNGAIKFDTAYFRGVADWLGEKLPAGGGLNGMSLESHIAFKDKITTLPDLRLSLDRQNMTGNLTIDAHGDVPSLKGALSIDRLDLNPYLQAGAKPSGPAKKPEAGWSKAPINVALLKKVDAELSLNAGALRLRNLRLGKTVANVTLKGGFLTARLDPITLYGGTGRAEFDVTSGEQTGPVIGSKLQFDHIALRPFLNDTLGIDRVEGAGSLALDIAAQGASAHAVMHALSGKGSIAANEGRIRGVNLGAVARTIQTVLGGGATGEIANTGFLDMGGSFVIAGGVLSNKDFRLAGAALQMTGAGTLDIGNRSIDFRLAPKAGAKGLSIGIPFRVKGSWDRVHYVPDLSGLVSGVMQNLEKGAAPFKGLFGGGNKTQDQGGGKKKKKSTGDVLKNMFGIH